MFHNIILNPQERLNSEQRRAQLYRTAQTQHNGPFFKAVMMNWLFYFLLSCFELSLTKAEFHVI